jgi:hypothetical protein
VGLGAARDSLVGGRGLAIEKIGRGRLFTRVARATPSLLISFFIDRIEISAKKKLFNSFFN